MATELNREFRFEPEGHKYFLGDLELPSVTTVLKDERLIDATWYDNQGRWRGSAIHLALQYLDEDTLDHDSVSPEHIGYVEAYLNFKAAYSFVPDLIEKPLWHPVFRYAGTPDRTGLINGNQAVLDIKTGATVPVDKIQLAAYAGMLGIPEAYERIRLHLKKDGKYGIKTYPREEASADFAVFLSALNVWNWKRKEKLWKAA